MFLSRLFYWYWHAEHQEKVSASFSWIILIEKFMTGYISSASQNERAGFCIFCILSHYCQPVLFVPWLLYSDHTPGIARCPPGERQNDGRQEVHDRLDPERIANNANKEQDRNGASVIQHRLEREDPSPLSLRRLFLHHRLRWNIHHVQCYP